MKKYYEILGLKEGASKEEIKKAYNKLSKELDPKKNNNEEFFVEETKKLNEAYEKLMNTSILSTKNIKESKQNDSSQDDNKNREKENYEIPTNKNSNSMKILEEISVAVLSVAMIKVIAQILFFPKIRAGRFIIDYDEIFLLTDEYEHSFFVYIFSVLLYLFLRFVLQKTPEKIITQTFYIFFITILVLLIGFSIRYSAG